jgi:uncharacterized protein
MKKRLNPTEIVLKELPPEGREFDYSNDSGELNDVLEDLIGKNPFSVNLSVRPIGNAYEIVGVAKSSYNLQCARCALDFKFPVVEKFHDVLVVNEPMHKGDQTVKTNHSSEWDPSQPEGVYLETHVFNVKEFIRELIALAEPFRPLGKPGCDEGKCENLAEIPEREWLSISSSKPVTIQNHPFSILEKMKLKS